VGAQPPTPSWGNMLREGRRYMREAWWVTTFPGLFIFITAMCFNMVGDGLRDALDPRLNKR
jgi:peptide/nickel transport system permease protein